MGINIHAATSYLYTRAHSYKEYAGKSCLMLGVQSIDSNGFEVYCSLGKMGFELSSEVHKLTRHEMLEQFDSYTYFKWLGFKKVKALDVSDYEGADIISNLNEPVSEELYNKYDVIYDGGTLEHVYNVPQAMKNIGDMLRTGGFVIHDAPAENYSNHGFYMFSPAFFYDYYRGNDYCIEELHLFNHVEGNKGSEYRSIDCRLVDPRPFFANKLDIVKEVSLLCCVARKTIYSVNGRMPIQGFYTETYADNEKLNQTVKAISDKYDRIVIYGTGANACKLYDLINKKKKTYLIYGERIDLPGKKYEVMSFEEALHYADCIVIGSFKFADIIEERIAKDCTAHDIRLVNMLDI